MEITDTHVNIVISFFVFSVIYFLTQNPLFGIVGAVGCYRVMSKRSAAKAEETTESN